MQVKSNYNYSNNANVNFEKKNKKDTEYSVYDLIDKKESAEISDTNDKILPGSNQNASEQYTQYADTKDSIEKYNESLKNARTQAYLNEYKKNDLF